jgi:hypothetical protein
MKDGGRYRIRTYPTSVFTTTCGTRVATKRPQRKPTEQLLDTDWTFPFRFFHEDPLNETTCRAKNKLGEQCRAIPSNNGFCSIHSQAGRAAELGRRSGESRKTPESEPLVLLPPGTAGDLHRALSEIFAKVGSGQMDSRLGRTLGYLASVLVKTTELSDHEIRLRTMEQMISSVRSERNQQ